MHNLLKGGTPIAGQLSALHLYVGGVVALGGLVGAAAVVGAPARAPGQVALLALLCGGAQLLRVRLPQASAVSAAVAVVFAAVLSSGLRGAVLVALAGGVVAAIVPLGSPLHKGLFNAGTWVLCAAVAYGIYRGLGGPEGALPGPLPAIPAAAAYYVVNAGLVAGAISLSSKVPVQAVWANNFRDLAPTYGILATLGYGMACAAVLGGPPALVGVAALLVLPWASLRVYAAQRSRADQARVVSPGC
jgi:hypothetical protein